MPSGAGVSGLAVAFAAGGGLLVYAGFKGLSPLGALKDVSGGKPSGVVDRSTSLQGADLSATPTGGALAGATLGAQRQGTVAAAQRYAADKYSQARRTQPGYSDCSSFCDKIFTDVGIPTPVKWASTANYRISPKWVTIKLSESMPGDIAINSHHMVLITAAGGTSAIGQQNPRVNVRTGTVNQLIDNYVVKRYVP
jgi:hypothetical protein